MITILLLNIWQKNLKAILNAQEKTLRNITFSVPIKKEYDNSKTTTYKLKFIDSYRFMQDSLSNLADNLLGIDNKEPKNKLIDTMRSMMASPSLSIDKVSRIDKKNHAN